MAEGCVVKTSLRLEKSVLEELQDAVEDNYGKLKGGQKEALREAVLLWLAYKRGIQVLLMNNDRTGKMEVFLGDSVGERLRGALLSRRRASVTLWRAGIDRRFLRGAIANVLSVLLELYGAPDEAGIIDLKGNALLEGLPVPADGREWEGALWRAEDGYDCVVAIRLLWRARRMSAVISPEAVSIHSINPASEF